MNNIILNGMLRDFADRHSLKQQNESGLFEKFCNYCVLSNDHYDSFEFDKVETGDALGIDGVAAVIGDAIIDQAEDATRFTQTQFSADFHFIQAKTSSSFDLGEFLKFTAAVRKFFQNDRDQVPEELHSAFDVKEVIYSRAGKLTALPTLRLWYCYSGEFQIKEKPVLGSIDAEVEALKALLYKFSDVSLTIVGATDLAGMYREAQNNTVGRVSFQRHVALPKMERATAAYIGVMRCKDYVDLIKKSNGEINKGLFYENVRDYLGIKNPVNKEIGQTISSLSSRDQFALLNNGVTLVASKVVPSGDTFELQRFQVVNGCQTSHVLFGSEESLSNDMHLTVKLIETSDADLTNEIIRSTNSQSLVMKEALATTRPYHRVLEDFFSALQGEGFRFLYERRPHQFDDVPGITQERIVSAPSLMKSFVSVVLEEPHKVHYYYGRLLEEYSTGETSELFSDDQYPGLYYAAHHIASRVRLKVLNDRNLKPWAFHIALLVKHQLAPGLNKAASFTDKNFRQLIDKITSDFEPAFKKAADFIRSKRFGKDENRLPAKTSEIVEGFRSAVSRPKSSSASSNADGDYIGRFESIDVDRGLVKIRYGSSLVEASVEADRFKLARNGELVRFAKKRGVVVQAELVSRVQN